MAEVIQGVPCNKLVVVTDSKLQEEGNRVSEMLLKRNKLELEMVVSRNPIEETVAELKAKHKTKSLAIVNVLKIGKCRILFGNANFIAEFNEDLNIKFNS